MFQHYLHSTLKIAYDETPFFSQKFFVQNVALEIHYWFRKKCISNMKETFSLQRFLLDEVMYTLIKVNFFISLCSFFCCLGRGSRGTDTGMCGHVKKVWRSSKMNKKQWNSPLISSYVISHEEIVDDDRVQAVFWV